MRKATLKSRDFTLLIQLFGEFNDRSVDVGCLKIHIQDPKIKDEVMQTDCFRSSFSSLSRELYPQEFHQTLQTPAISLPMDTRVCVCINLCVPHHEQHVLG